MDQAGAFIKARWKKLSDYIRLFKTRQHELLRSQPKLPEYDKTVLTAWEVNFKQVEDESPDAAKFLLLLCFLDLANITEDMLLRGCSPQKIWDANGEIGNVPAEFTGVDGEVIRLITDELAYDAVIDKLSSFSLVRRNNDVNEARSISLHPLVQYCASQGITSRKRPLEVASSASHMPRFSNQSVHRRRVGLTPTIAAIRELSLC